jgi:class 3 adenylate cyclase/pimeloyl-ACP methyl ester carboxylesterase
MQREDPGERRLTAILAADMAGYSRLMEVDEAGVLDRHKRHRRELIDPTLEQFGGKIVKTTGDGLIAIFTSVQDAVRAALAIQAAMQAREGGNDESRCILYRIGINLGDVVFEDGDVFGDAVNVAARLEALARPGGICIADLVHQLTADRLDVAFQDLGVQRVKNITRQIRVWQWTPEPPSTSESLTELANSQEVRFCTSRDGTQIAYARIGRGPPVLKAPNWLNHLEYEWRSPAWGPVWRGFAKNFELVRFDQRGNGLSDWEVEEISEDAMIQDMEAVADAAGLERVALFGISQGCAFTVRYAAEHPDRVACLVLLGGYLRGRLRRNDANEERLVNMAATMIRQGWGSPNRAFRHFFTESFMPDATPEQAAHFDELQRIAITPENAERIWQMNAEVDVSVLAAEVRAPTLVLHCRDDRMCSLKEGRRMAGAIPNARFIELEGANHALLENTPAFDQFFAEVEPFIRRHTG